MFRVRVHLLILTLVGFVNSQNELGNFSTPEECLRPCTSETQPRICHYNFNIEYYPALNQACDICKPTTAQTLSSLPACECIVLDGVERTVFSINRMVPGPQIQICKNDFVVVDVLNEAEGMGVSLHWHGIYQNNYQYYDGVPFVTQCPIDGFTKFRYQFKAQQSGTFFWHSHVATHRLDGQYGSLIIRDIPENEPNWDLYDEDDPAHVILISDWMHHLSTERFPGLRVDFGQSAENLLINGRGKWTFDNGTQSDVDYETFHVRKGKRYRFRLINAFTTICFLQLSIEGHSMKIIAQDGSHVVPRDVNTIITAAGERVDFILNAQKSVKSYWIQSRAIGECEPKKIQQLAVLNYQGASEKDINQPPTYLEGFEQGIVYNSVNTDCSEEEKESICSNGFKSASKVDPDIMKVEPDYRFIIPFSFRYYDNISNNFHNIYVAKKTYFPDFFVTINAVTLVSLFDGVIFKTASAPPLTQDEGFKSQCKKSDFGDCRSKGDRLDCSCTNIKKIAINSTIEIILYDEFVQPDLSHPFHLHGYSFHIFDMGRLKSVTTYDFNRTVIDNVIETHTNRLKNNFYDLPPGKDTVVVPQAGWVILRFKANNPGFWAFHCHFDWHSTTGMMLIFQVGERSDLPPVPHAFPTCGNFVPPIKIIN